MEKSKLITLFKTFSNSEFKRFDDFVHSPFVNKQQAVTNLFDEIKNSYPAFEVKYIKKEIIYKKLYGITEYRDELMRYLISQMLRLAEKFLVAVNLENNSFREKSMLLEELNQRKLEGMFERHFILLKNILDNQKIKDKEYYFNKYLAETIYQNHLDKTTFKPVLANDNAQNVADNLTSFFIMEILDEYIYMVNQMRIYPERNYNMPVADGLIKLLSDENNPFNSTPLIKIYFNLYMLTTAYEEIYFTVLSKLLSEYTTQLSRITKIQIYTILHNYAQNKIFQGDDRFVREKFFLYKESFRNEGSYDYDNYVNNTDLINAVSYSLILNEFSEAENFILNYAPELDPFYKHSTESLCHATISYYKKDFGKALELLARVKNEDISYKLNIKALTLMIYFSAGETEPFYSLADSFKHFVNGNKLLTERYKILHLNFINFTARLFKGINEETNFDLSKFREELISTNNITKKRWLIETVRKLEKK